VTIRHTITNHRITLRVFECEPTSKITRLNGALRWVTSKELMKLAMPAAHRRALEKIGHFRQ
jgi:adenine-specific DNA glycosylase